LIQNYIIKLFLVFELDLYMVKCHNSSFAFSTSVTYTVYFLQIWALMSKGNDAGS